MFCDTSEMDHTCIDATECPVCESEQSWLFAEMATVKKMGENFI